MKNKKILAVVISCLLLIGVAAGITASAADTPAVAIAETNISYEGAVKILYTLDTANIQEGQTAKVVFSYDADAAAPSGTLNADDYAFVGEAFDLTVGGEERKAVYSDGFAPADMRKTVYAIPVVVDAQGAVVASGAKVGFSVYDYMMARLGGTYTPEQYMLYVSALDFGGSVQNAQKITDGAEVTDGYADEYYVLKVMDGDGKVTTYSYREPTDISLKAPKGYNGKLFDSFVDNKGVKYEGAELNIYNFKLDKIGTTYIKYVYGDTEISMESLNASEGMSASLANPDTSVVVKGGAEYFVEADVMLSDGAVATLDFMADETVKIGTVNLSESDGTVTVTDGISTFTMANDSVLRVEYVVISATANTGTLFYYVNNEYICKSDVPSVDGTSNASFASVVASATAGEIALNYVDIGAKDGVVTFTTVTDVSTVVYDYDAEYGKYFWYKKSNDAADGGKLRFEITDAVQPGATTTFEAKVKLSGNFIASGTWRNAINIFLQTEYYTDAGRRYTVLNKNIAFTPTALHYDGAANGGTQYSITNAIASGVWFDLKIEHVGSTSFSIYINGEQVYTASNGTSATDMLDFIPSSGGAGSIYMTDIKYTSK